MSFQAMTWAIKQRVGNATGKAILLMLSNYANEKGECWPSQETLADECECSVATIARWISVFEDAGFLTRRKQYGEGGYRRADVLCINPNLPVTKLPSRELPNSESKLTRHSDGAEPIREPINTVSDAGESADRQIRNSQSSLQSKFDQFWNAYPHKVGKRDAEKSFAKALKRSAFDEIMDGLRRYASKTDDRPWCNPTTFLNQDRWTDMPAAPSRQSHSPNGQPRNVGEAAFADLSERGTDDVSDEFKEYLFGGNGQRDRGRSQSSEVLALPFQRHDQAR